MTIALAAVTKTYKTDDSEVFALTDVSLTITSGEFAAIMGPLGSGKSTLMNILGCLDRPTTGSYTLDGEEVATLSDDALAVTRNQKIGFVSQNFSLLPRMSILQNIMLPLISARISKQERFERAEQALLMVGLGGRMRHRPTGLSGGQRQRMAIARALVNNPAIVLADEPTGNLNTKSGNEIMDIFSELNYLGRTVILVTQRADIARRMRRVIHVRDGRIVLDERR